MPVGYCALRGLFVFSNFHRRFNIIECYALHIYISPLRQTNSYVCSFNVNIF